MSCCQDSVIIVNVGRLQLRLGGAMEVIESVVYDDLTKLSEDLEKVIECKYAYS